MNHRPMGRREEARYVGCQVIEAVVRRGNAPELKLTS